jgi:hypothetical protein
MAQEPVIWEQPGVSATQRLNLAQVRRALSAGDACVASPDVAIACCTTSCWSTRRYWPTGDSATGWCTSYTSLR